MIKKIKVYDPLTNTWSTGYWIPVFDKADNIIEYLPVWQDQEKILKKTKQDKKAQ